MAIVIHRRVLSHLCQRFIVYTKIAIVLGFSVVVLGCTSFQVSQQSTPELRERFNLAERELASYHPEESDQARLRRYRHLTEEEHSIERELFRRCRAGDHGACLPYFHLIADDI
jgi:hypothetical protein